MTKDGSITTFSIILCAVSLLLYKRYELVFLSKIKHSPHFSSNKIAKIVNYNHKTTTMWLNCWDERKDLVDPPRSRALRTTIIEQDQMVVDTALREMDITNGSMKEELKMLGIDTSESTVQPRVKIVGAKYTKPLSKPLLSEWHREQHLASAKFKKNYNWNQILGTDEILIQLIQLPWTSSITISRLRVK